MKITTIAFWHGPNKNDIANIDVNLSAKAKKKFKIGTKSNSISDFKGQRIEKVRFEDGSFYIK